MIEATNQVIQRIDLNDHVNDWLEYKKVHNLNERSQVVYKNIVINMIRYFEAKDIQLPSLIDMNEYKQHLQKKMTATAINLYIIAVRSFFKFLHETGRIANGCWHIKSVKVAKRNTPKRGYVEFDDYKKMLAMIDRNTIEGLRLTAILNLKSLRGLRDFQVTTLRVCDFIKKGSRYFVNVIPKGQTERVQMEIKPVVADSIIRFQKALRDSIKQKKQDPLFPSFAANNYGGTLSTRAVQNWVGGLLDNLHLDQGTRSNISSHALRHSFGTWSVQKNVPIRVVQQLMMHSDVSTTEMYLNWNNEENNADQFGEALADELKQVEEVINA